MARAIAIGLLAGTAPVRADDHPPSASIRVGAAVGELSEPSWFLPEVDLVVHVPIGRAFVSGTIGYAIPDDHTYLADGQDYRVVVEGGARAGKWRASGGLGLDYVLFHADPDVETDHPGVDQLVHRTAVLPTVNAEVAYAIGSATSIGVYGLVALRELRLFDTPSGDHLDARLALVGAFIEVRLR